MSIPSPFIVSIVGGIAVGKTTIGRDLHSLINDSIFIQENADSNLFLRDFYQDMKKWCFHSRISTLSLILNNYFDFGCFSEKNIKVVILDRCINELINFANVQYELGNLSDKEFLLYGNLYNSIVKLVPKIDLFLYCYCNPTTSLERIKIRNRPYEANIDLKYINMINKQYSNWIYDQKSSKTMQIDTDKCVDLKRIVDSIVYD